MMQTPHHFFSPDPFERNLGRFRKTPNEGTLFYGGAGRQRHVGCDLLLRFLCGYPP